MQNLKQTILFSSLMILGPMLLAQDLEEGTTLKLEEEITMKQTIPPVDIAGNVLNMDFLASNKDVVIIDAEQIQAMAIHQAADLLKYLAHIEVVERGPNGVQSDIKLNGGTFEQALILINGHKIMDAQTGHHLMNLPINMDQVERVEILRGAAARIYGVNSLTGAINFVMKSDIDGVLEANISWGSNFEKNEEGKIYNGTNIQLASAFKTKSEVQHFFTGAYHQGSGYRYNTAYDQAKFYYTLKKDWNSRTALNVFASTIYNDFGTNGFYAPPGDKESVETVSTTMAGAEVKWQMMDNWSSSFKTSYRFNWDDYRFIKQDPSYYQNIHHNHLLQGIWMNYHDLKFVDLRWGVDMNQTWIRSSNLGDWNRFNSGLFLDIIPQWEIPLQINAGLYVNYNQDWGLKILPGIDASYKINSNLALFAGWATGQRIPTYTDLYYVGPSNIGNEHLKPEYSNQLEGGLKGEWKAMSWSVSYFHRKITDLIDWVKEDINDPWRPDNFGAVTTNGLHLNMQYHWKSEDWQVFVIPSYTYLQNTTNHFENKISNYQLEYLKHKFALVNQVKFKERYAIAPAYRYEQRVSDANYHMFDIRLSYNNSLGEIYLDVNNIGNVKQVDFYALPLVGRWVNLGMKFKI